MKNILSIVIMSLFALTLNAQHQKPMQRNDSLGISPEVSDSLSRRNNPSLRSDSTINRTRDKSQYPNTRDTIHMDDRKSKDRMMPDSTRIK